MKVTVIPIVVGELGTVIKDIAKIGENTEKSPGDLRKLASLKLQLKIIC